MVLGVLTSQILTLAKSHAHLKGGPSPSPQGCPWWLAMSQATCMPCREGGPLLGLSRQARGQTLVGQSCPCPLSAGPRSSSLELLASLTPEAFSLDGSLRGKQRMSKQDFLQAHNGQGLRAARPTDDPLSLLDPLWTLNKT